MNRLSWIAAVIFLLFHVSSAPSAAADPEEGINRIQSAYEKITDVRGSFVQKNVVSALNRSDTYKGEFFIKRPLKMKWSYKGKAAQDLTVNDDTVLIYRQGDSVAYRAKFDRATFGQTPVALLGGFGNIREEFTVSGGRESITLVPRNPMGNVKSIRIFLSETGFPIRAFIIDDGQTNIVEIELSNVKVNTGLKDGIFDLTVPKGVSVYEQ